MNPTALAAQRGLRVGSFLQEVLVQLGCLAYFSAAALAMTWPLASLSVSEMAGLLPVAEFFRVHNSYLVNIGHIEKIENNHVYCNGAVIPIGAKYKDDFMRKIGGV